MPRVEGKYWQSGFDQKEEIGEENWVRVRFTTGTRERWVREGRWAWVSRLKGRGAV